MLEDLAAWQVGFATVWLLGVSMGMTACTVTCLPFMGTWALGRAGSASEAFAHTAVFLAGRITSYMLLGALAGGLGEGLARALGGGLGNAAVGAASIIAGLWLLARPMRTCGDGALPAAAPLVRRERKPDGLPPLFLGAALTLTPCTPLASLLAVAADTGSVPAGAAYGVVFGFGAAVTPILVLVPLAGRLGRQLRDRRAWLARWLTFGAAAVLILLGLRRLLLAFA